MRDLLPDIPTLPIGLLADIRREPTYVLETIALAAVEFHGPAAARWLTSKEHLQFSQEGLAKIAVRRSTNGARLEGAALGVGGLITLAPDLLALAWILTREVIFVAAAMGKDPTDPARAAEVLVICEVYPTIEQAQAALDHRGERLAVALAKFQTVKHLSPAKQRSLTNRLTRFAGKRFARRYGARMLPGIGAVLGAMDNGAAVKDTGRRAIAFYRA